jgi:hypothetical protein
MLLQAEAVDRPALVIDTVEEILGPARDRFRYLGR